MFGAGWLIWTAVGVGYVIRSTLDGRDALVAAGQAALALDFVTARQELAMADRSFRAAETRRVSVAWVKVWPWARTQLEASERIISVGHTLIGVMTEAMDLGSELARLSGFIEETRSDVPNIFSRAVSFGELSPEMKHVIVRRLSWAAPDLMEMVVDIDLALDELDDARIRGVAWPIIKTLLPIEKKLRDARDALQTLSVMAVLLPSFSGFDGQTDLLLLFLNNTELRPGGGFLGTYGVLRMKDGELLDLSTRDAYVLDRAADPFLSVEPPRALRQYNAAEEWYFRDSNWSPDFAVSAEQSLRLFQREVMAIPSEARQAIQPPVSVEAVVGFTPTFAADLLEITGPVVIGAQRFTADNITDTLEYQVERGFDEQGIPFAQRKEVMAQLVQEVSARLFTLSLTDWMRMFDVIASNVKSKQLVFYHADADTQAVLTQAGWAGRMTSDSVDTLLVVDANLASLKSDPVVLRDLFYAIDQSAEGPVATVTIHYTHQGSFDWKTTRYRTYTRIYVPYGSVLLDSSGSLRDDKIKNPSGEEGEVSVDEELGFTTFGAFTSVEPGETRELQFQYRLPESVSDAIASDTYSLKVLKQIGAAEYGLTLDLDFDKKVTTATPEELEHFWGDDVYAGAFGLASDVTVRVELE
jgi:hypothetical protein